MPSIAELLLHVVELRPEAPLGGIPFLDLSPVPVDNTLVVQLPLQEALCSSLLMLLTPEHAHDGRGVEVRLSAVVEAVVLR